MRELLARSGPVDVIVEGLAASAASLLAMIGETIRIAPGSQMMIHESRGGAMGGAATMEAAAQMLRNVNDSTAQIYADRTGLPLSEVQSMMAAETWLSAEQAVKLGFATAIAGPAVQMSARWDLSAYRNTPAALNLATRSEKDTVSTMAISKELAARLGLSETASESDVLAALDAQLARPAAAPAPVQAPDLSAAVTAAVTAALRARDADAQHVQACTATVERFIRDGKVRPADRDAAMALCGKSAESLSKAAQYWEAAPKLLAEPATLGTKPPKGLAQTSLTPAQMKHCADCNIKPETYLTVLNERAAQ